MKTSTFLLIIGFPIILMLLVGSKNLYLGCDIITLKSGKEIRAMCIQIEAEQRRISYKECGQGDSLSYYKDIAEVQTIQYADGREKVDIPTLLRLLPSKTIKKEEKTRKKPNKNGRSALVLFILSIILGVICSALVSSGGCEGLIIAIIIGIIAFIFLIMSIGFGFAAL